MPRLIRDNGLTLVLTAMFLVSMIGMVTSGRAVFNKDLLDHGGNAASIGTYLTSGAFLSALFENWESEFLQMAVYVVLTAMLFQRASAESRDPDDPVREEDALPAATKRKWPLTTWLYSHSLGLALALLFVASFILHWYGSMEAANEQAMLHGGKAQTLFGYLGDPELWFESFQNWQSEFLSTAVLVVLSIFLRHQGSPESKPVATTNFDTGA